MAPMMRGVIIDCLSELPSIPSGHSGAVQRVHKADLGADSARHREAIPPAMFHVCRLRQVAGWCLFHGGCRQPDPLHRGFPQVPQAGVKEPRGGAHSS